MIVCRHTNGVQNLGRINSKPPSTLITTTCSIISKRLYVQNCQWLLSLFRGAAASVRVDIPSSISMANLTPLDRNYLTRRIRRYVYGPDIESVFEKQITIPLIIPWDLENYILHQLPQDFQDLPTHATEHKTLIPVHDTSRYDPTTAVMPSLQDEASEKGNVRYWVITNSSMWAGQHRAIDEISEMLWSLSYWFTETVDILPSASYGTEAKECLWHMARACRRRLVLPRIPRDDGHDHRISSSSSPAKSMTATVPTLHENLLFRSWAFRSPMMPEWPSNDSTKSKTRPQEIRQSLIDEHVLLYEFSEHLFWTKGDEGEWNEDC